MTHEGVSQFGNEFREPKKTAEQVSRSRNPQVFEQRVYQLFSQANRISRQILVFAATYLNNQHRGAEEAVAIIPGDSLSPEEHIDLYALTLMKIEKNPQIRRKLQLIPDSAFTYMLDTILSQELAPFATQVKQDLLTILGPAQSSTWAIPTDVRIRRQIENGEQLSKNDWSRMRQLLSDYRVNARDDVVEQDASTMNGVVYGKRAPQDTNDEFGRHDRDVD